MTLVMRYESFKNTLVMLALIQLRNTERLLGKNTVTGTIDSGIKAHNIPTKQAIVQRRPKIKYKGGMSLARLQSGLPLTGGVEVIHDYRNI